MAITKALIKTTLWSQKVGGEGHGKKIPALCIGRVPMHFKIRSGVTSVAQADFVTSKSSPVDRKNRPRERKTESPVL